jgi:ribosomal protein L16 Arg81 hydroxylase
MVFAASDAVRSLLDRERVEHWLRNANLRYPQATVSYGAQDAGPSTYTRTRTTITSPLAGFIDADRIAEHVDNGATLVLYYTEQWDGALARFCAELAAPLAATVRTFGYLTAPGQDGSVPHRDNPDVFVVQVAGSKHWRLYDLPEGARWKQGPIDGPATPTRELLLTAGDVLYIPRGMGHDASAGPDGSLHLSVTVATPSLTSVVEQWAARAAAGFDPQERLGPGPDGRVEAVRAVLARLAADLAATDPADLVAAVAPGAPEPARRLAWPV